MPYRLRNHSHGKQVQVAHTHLAKPPKVTLVSPEHAHFALPRRIPHHHFEVDTVATALGKVDQAKHLQEARGRYTVVVWDKKSAINGTPAKEVLAGLDHDYEDIYLVFIDGDLSIFQPHEPFSEGIVTMKSGSGLEEHGLRHVERLARGYAAGSILTEVIDHLGVPPTPSFDHIEQFGDDEVPGL